MSVRNTSEKCTPIRCIPVICTPGRCTPGRCTPGRCTPGRCMPIRWTMGVACGECQASGTRIRGRIRVPDTFREGVLVDNLDNLDRSEAYGIGLLEGGCGPSS